MSEKITTEEMLEYLEWTIKDMGDTRNFNIREAIRALILAQPELEKEVEQLHVQLAGCGVAALGWANHPVEVRQGDYGWSQSFQDVLDLRAKYETLLSAQPAVEQLVEDLRRSSNYVHTRTALAAYDAAMRGEN